jgi:hypothetical protein
MTKIHTEGNIDFYLCPHKYEIHSSAPLVVRNANTGVPLSGTNALPAVAAGVSTRLACNIVV